MLSYGGNDLRRVVIGKVSGDEYVEEYLQVLEHIRAFDPSVPCLLTTITDHLRILTYDVKAEHVEVIVEAQREVARRAGCAFFDTYTAMGGRGSMAEWRKKKLAAPDLKHLNRAGRKVVGGWMYDAIIAGYVDYRRRGGAGEKPGTTTDTSASTE
jgi:lysophospholipase L1-like esterase